MISVNVDKADPTDLYEQVAAEIRRAIADGEAKRILTAPSLALEASIVPPQISQIFQGLSFLGFPSDVIDVSDAKKLLVDRLKVLRS